MKINAATFYRSTTVPAVSSKMQQVVGFRNDTAQLRENTLSARPHGGAPDRASVNVTENGRIADLDAEVKDRCKIHAKARAVKGYKQARAIAKRARQATRQYTGAEGKRADRKVAEVLMANW